jgi:proline racemase
VLPLLIVVVTLVGFTLDRVMTREGVPRTDVLLLTNLVTGIAAGVIGYQIIEAEREQRRLMQQRLETIAQMNHHIRNALQVIVCVRAQHAGDESLDVIHEAIERIDWALREILPHYGPSESPRNGRSAAA